MEAKEKKCLLFIADTAVAKQTLRNRGDFANRFHAKFFTREEIRGWGTPRSDLGENGKQLGP